MSEPTLTPTRAAELERGLRELAPGMKLSRSAADLAAYARDLWPRGLIELQHANEAEPERAQESRLCPFAIAWPASSAEVAALVRFARAEALELVPFGAGSGVAGGIYANPRSLIVDLKGITDFEVLPGPTLDVGAGALGITLEERLLDAGFTTGHYPSSILCSTVGGWVAARGVGQCSGRYGKIEDMVGGLEVVLGTGEVVSLKSRERGPDLVPLFVGSEGTLGVITRARLRLHAAPVERAFEAYAFRDIEQGIGTLRRIYQNGLRPAVARLYDPLDTLLLKDDEPSSSAGSGPKRSVEKSAAETRTFNADLNARKLRSQLQMAVLRAGLHAPAWLGRAMFWAERHGLGRVALVVMHEGSPGEVEQSRRGVASLCRDAQAEVLGPGPAQAWYRHRYHVSYRQSALFRAGLFVDTMEVSAPWSRIPQVYQEVRRAFAARALIMAHFSHSYPDGGSIYFTFAGTAHAGKGALQVYDEAWRAGLSAAVAAGATLSHHHGIGRSKAARMPEALGTQLLAQRTLKACLDPDGVLNRGSLLPDAGQLRESELRAPAASPSAAELSAIDHTATLPGAWTLGRSQEFLSRSNHRLAIDTAGIDWSVSLDAWVGLGMPGAPDRFSDPNGARLSGYVARLPSGLRVASGAAPRRAVGPDLSALWIGTQGAFGVLESVTLFTPQQGSPEPPEMPYTAERNPPVSGAEKALLESLRCAYVKG